MKKWKRWPATNDIRSRGVFLAAASLAGAILVTIVLIGRDTPRVKRSTVASQVTKPTSLPKAVQSANTPVTKVSPAPHSAAQKVAAPTSTVDPAREKWERARLDAALRLAAAKLRKQAIEVEVRNEPVEETIAKLLEDPLADNFASSHSTYLHRVLDEPRVRKLLDIARNGSDAERQWLAEEVREKLSSALDQMPPFIPEGEPFQPTLTSPGGALGLSLVLAETESSPSSLDLIVEMHRRGQAATKDHIRTQRGEDFQKVLLEHPYVMSRYGMVLAYSSDQILSRWAEGNVPGLELTQDQAQMLVEYSANRIKWTDSSQGYYTYQSDILEFAERIAGSTISNGDIPK